MARMFGEEFMRTTANTIKYNDLTVHAIYKRGWNGAIKIRIQRISAANEAANGVTTQGINIRVKGAKLRVANSYAEDIVLWSDTAPADVILESDGDVREVMIWNSYRTVHGTEEAWVGNSGMLIDDVEGGLLRFSCNSRSVITFQDLVFDVGLSQL